MSLISFSDSAEIGNVPNFGRTSNGRTEAGGRNKESMKISREAENSRNVRSRFTTQFYVSRGAFTQVEYNYEKDCCNRLPSTDWTLATSRRATNLQTV